MKDRPLSTTHVASALCWVAGFALAVAYAFTEIRGLGVLGLLFAVAGATLTVRGYVVHLTELLGERQAAEQNAFELGQDAARFRRRD
jgi:hypothetical protein